MMVTMLSGWRYALISVTALVVLAWLQPDLQVVHVALLAGVSMLSGEALRRGASPTLAWFAQMLPAAAMLPSLLAQPASLHLDRFASTAAQAGINVALAVVAMLLLPRRSAHFPARCRSRLDHYAFAGVVGAVSASAIGLLAGGVLESVPATAVRLSVLMGLALLASQVLTVWGRVVTTLVEQDFTRPPIPGKVTRDIVPRARLPVELAACSAELRRQINVLRRNAERSKRQLHELRRVALHLQDELKRSQDVVRERSRKLDSFASEGEEARARYSALMEGWGEAVIFVDTSGLITDASQSALSLLGRQSAELVGKPLALLIPHDHVTPHPFDNLKAEPPSERAVSAAGPVLAAAGKTRQVDIHVQPFQAHGAQQRLIRLRETDHMQLAVATLEEAERVNRSADQARDVFVATMSHELRTPLHGLIATLDMLRAGGTTNEDFQHQLSIARSSARALLKIANDVLDVTRIKSNLFTLERQRFSMNTILREVVEEASARAASLGLALASQVANELPPSFVGDPGRLKQILGNLVSNALKFTAAGAVTLRVQYDGKLCTVDVRDTGEGIPAAKHGVIFEPFVQLGSKAGRQAGGTGLGLPISRQLAEAMKGELTLLQSGPQGSTFRLSLPLEASNEPPPEDDSQRIFTNPRGRILVVEDNPANRYVAEALLAGMECPATIVEGGQEALNLLHEEEFDLILMDCQMPGMDGYETTRRARQMLSRRVPIIAMTANAMADDRSHCLAAGMDDFLPKPFNRQALNAVLRKWLAPGSNATTEAATDLDARIGMHADLDVGVFDELRESLQWKSEPLERIRSSFTSSVKQVLPLLKDPDVERKLLLRHLHTLMGSSGMVGARQVEYLAGQMQRAFKENRAGAMDGAADILAKALQRYERAVERRLNTGTDTLRVGRPGY